ncbi:hypothetical protein SNEBB_003128 [Seison nebaliae]|nr:hypothetical protein SNEBB_003128 [Seison nebaliae]
MANASNGNESMTPIIGKSLLEDVKSANGDEKKETETSRPVRSRFGPPINSDLKPSTRFSAPENDGKQHFIPHNGALPNNMAGPPFSGYSTFPPRHDGPPPMFVCQQFPEDNGFPPTNPQTGLLPPPAAAPLQIPEVWVEVPTSDGKPYYYHSISRETRWDPPDNLQIMNQIEFDQMMAQRLTSQQSLLGQQPISQQQSGMFSQPIQQQQPLMNSKNEPLESIIRKLGELEESCNIWNEYLDRENKKVYYFNSKTFSSSWDYPECWKEREELLKEKKKQLELMENKAIYDPFAANNKGVDNGNGTGEYSNVPIENTPKKKKEEKPDHAVSNRTIPGTPWCVVWTLMKKVFYFNPTTKISSWTRPEELVPLSSLVDQMITGGPNGKLPSEMMDDDDKKDDQIHLKMDQKMNENNNLSQEIAPNLSNHNMSNDGNGLMNTGDMNKPLEERIEIFRSLLREKDISAFTSWERELHKIVLDERYTILNGSDRRKTYDAYVREKAEDEGKLRRQQAKEKRNNFIDLIDEVFEEKYEQLMEKKEEIKMTSSILTFAEFSRTYKDDDRFKNFDRVSEQKSLFNERMKKLLSRKDRKSYSHDPPSIDQKVKKDKIHSNGEQKKSEEEIEEGQIDDEDMEDSGHRRVKDRRAHDDDDYDSQDDHHRKRNREKHSLKDNYFELLKEFKTDIIEMEYDWPLIKRKIRDDKRYVYVDSSRRRQDWFHEFCHKLDDMDDSMKSRSHHKRQDTTGSGDDGDMKKRKYNDAHEARLREVANLKAEQHRDLDHTRKDHNREYSEQIFRNLLIDHIKETNLEWSEIKRILKKDDRWESARDVERNRRDELIEEHSEELEKKQILIFHKLLERVLEEYDLEHESNRQEEIDDDHNPISSFQLSWKELKRLLRNNAQYERLTISNLESEAKDFMKKRLKKAKNDFRELLEETKTITHETFDEFQTNERAVLKRICHDLNNDKRFLQLYWMNEKRTTIIREHLINLSKKGMPKPPT